MYQSTSVDEFASPQPERYKNTSRVSYTFYSQSSTLHLKVVTSILSRRENRPAKKKVGVGLSVNYSWHGARLPALCRERKGAEYLTIRIKGWQQQEKKTMWKQRSK